MSKTYTVVLQQLLLTGLEVEATSAKLAKRAAIEAHEEIESSVRNSRSLHADQWIGSTVRIRFIDKKKPQR